MKIKFEHQRVPDLPFIRQTTKGRPNPAMLYDYQRGSGFLEWTEIKPYAKGGAVCCVLTGEWWLLAGIAVCSMSDIFSYQTGRELSLLRATNLGLGHELDIGVMYQLQKWEKKLDDEKIFYLNLCLIMYQDKLKSSPNTLYFHPETAEITPKIDGFTVKTSPIILKNHVWIGFEE